LSFISWQRAVGLARSAFQFWAADAPLICAFRRIAAKISTQGKRLSRGLKMLRRAAGAVSASIFDAYVSSRPPSKATGRLADVLSNAASEFQ
jgi:hypothetical protein